MVKGLALNSGDLGWDWGDEVDSDEYDDGVDRHWGWERIRTVFFGNLEKGGEPFPRKRRHCFVFFGKRSLWRPCGKSVRIFLAMTP